MANRPTTVTQAEIKRTVAAARAAGERGRIEVDHRAGKVIIYPEQVSEGPAQQPADREKDEAECDKLFGLAS